MRRTSVTTADVARHSGVSRATVSYVLNGRTGMRISPATTLRVQQAAAALGYRRNPIATALRTGRMHSIGLVSSIAQDGATHHTQNTYGPYLFLELSLAAARVGMNANIFVDALGLPLRPDAVMDGRVDGLIFFAYYDTSEWVEEAYTLGLPCVEIGSAWGRFQVHQDNAGGARLAAAYLLALGHRRIGYWRGPEAVVSARARANGFQFAMQEAGLTVAEAPVVSSPEEFAALLKRPDRPTAFFVRDTVIAIEAFDLICAAGLRVPEDVSLIGYDNDLRAMTMRPALTTVQNPLAGMAEAAVRLLRAQVDGLEIETDVEVVPTHLIVRDSTAPPAS